MYVTDLHNLLLVSKQEALLSYLILIIYIYTSNYSNAIFIMIFGKYVAYLILAQGRAIIPVWYCTITLRKMHNISKTVFATKFYYTYITAYCMRNFSEVCDHIFAHKHHFYRGFLSALKYMHKFFTCFICKVL